MFTRRLRFSRLLALCLTVPALGCGAGNDAPLRFTSGPTDGGGGQGNNSGGGSVGSGGGGGAGARPGSISSLDGGSGKNPPVDPSIIFDWPVDNPTPAIGCQSGLYTGTFDGFYSSYLTAVGVPLPVTGDVNLTLDESTNGEFFTISNGSVSGTADGFLAQYSCRITGTLNCTTKKLENGRLEDCIYCLGSFTDDAGGCGLAGYFSGPLTADYNAANQSFENGTWDGAESMDAGLTEEAGTIHIGPDSFGGGGTWTAKHGP
jgi:hypothetical protein